MRRMVIRRGKHTMGIFLDERKVPGLGPFCLVLLFQPSRSALAKVMLSNNARLLEFFLPLSLA